MCSSTFAISILQRFFAFVLVIPKMNALSLVRSHQFQCNVASRNLEVMIKLAVHSFSDHFETVQRRPEVASMHPDV